MSTAVANTEVSPEAAPEPKVRIAIDLPRECVEWLELKALRRKQQLGEGHVKKSPIVQGLIEAAMRDEPK